VILPGIAAVLLLLLAAEYTTERLLLNHNPPPGRMVNIGGYRLHLYCAGQGPSTIVFEAGLGDSSLIWSDIQKAISDSVRACSYDRGGIGWSDKSPLPRDPMSETTELHLLLERAGISGPVILVGYSMGGDLVRLFASRFPTRIAGLILVEPSNEDQWNRIPGLAAEWQQYRRDCRWDSWKARIGWLRFQHQPLDDYPVSVRTLAERLSYAPKAAAANCQEINSIIGSGPAEVAQARTLGNIPLIVITAWHNIFADDDSLPAPEKAGEIWKQMQKETSALSSRGEQVYASESGHFVQHDQPEMIVSQIRRLLEEAARSYAR
jgi:pimeloyl-ACP methyl ester carboxylesterase